MQMNRPGALAITRDPPRYERAIADSDVTSSDPLKRTTAGKVETAGDGDFVVGIATHSAEAGELVSMLVEGSIGLRARSGATLTQGRKVRAAASSEVDEGSDELHFLGRVVSHDSTENRVEVAVRAGQANMNELGQIENDLDYDAMITAKRFAVAMSAAMGG